MLVIIKKKSAKVRPLSRPHQPIYMPVFIVLTDIGKGERVPLAPNGQYTFEGSP